MTKDEGIPDIKTEIFIDVKSIIESIIESLKSGIQHEMDLSML